MAADIGKIFEHEMTKVFRLLKKTHLLGWHRFLDSGAAGNIVDGQPSDFLLLLPPETERIGRNQVVFLEAKASEKSHTLGKAAVRPAQRGAIAEYSGILGVPYYILFWDAQLGVMQLWDGKRILDERNLKPGDALKTWEGVGAGMNLRTEFVASCLSDYFLIPLASETLKNVR